MPFRRDKEEVWRAGLDLGGRGAEAETVKGTMGLRPKGSPHVGL